MVFNQILPSNILNHFCENQALQQGGYAHDKLFQQSRTFLSRNLTALIEGWYFIITTTSSSKIINYYSHIK